MSIVDLRKMNKAALTEELQASQKELFNMRMQKGSSQSIKPHLISKVKKQIARLHTLISEKV